VEGEGFEPSVPETDSAFVTSAFRSLNTHPRRGSGSFDRGTEGSNRPPSTGDLQTLGPSRDARPEDHPGIRFAARLLELSAAIEPLSNARWRTLISCWKAAFPRAGKKPGIPSKSASAPKDVIFNPAGRATNSATMVSPTRNSRGSARLSRRSQ
jgi:hypothetical protein